MSSLEKYLAQDRMNYYPFFSKGYFLDWLLKSEQYWLRSYVSALRKEEYYTWVSPNRLFKYFYQRRKNSLGSKLGIFISAGNFGMGLKIYHYGSIIINPNAKIGKHCTLHGNCCIGNKGAGAAASPVIGDHVDIGQGAQLLGDITIADGVRVGAGAIVTKSVLEPNVTVVGVPARILHKKN